jgi:hypothetical protein
MIRIPAIEPRIIPYSAAVHRFPHAWFLIDSMDSPPKCFIGFKRILDL